MPTLINDPLLEERLRAERALSGADRFDEVWEGVYVMSPLADNIHQRLQGGLVRALFDALRDNANVFPGVNVSDRRDDWKHNYRCPDVAVFLPGNPAEDLGTHWFGGPDFAVEVISPYDHARKKLAFYASVGVRELLIVDRKPWSLELLRLKDGSLQTVGRSTPDDSVIISSEVLPVELRLIPGDPRPTIAVASRDGKQSWNI